MTIAQSCPKWFKELNPAYIFQIQLAQFNSPYSKAINLFFNRRHTLWAQIEDIIREGGNIINDEFRLKPFAENFIEREAKNAGFDRDIFRETAIKKYQNKTADFQDEEVDDEKFRHKEYLAFTADERPAKEDRNDFDIYTYDLDDYEQWIKKYFQRIVRVERLRETRVFTGFSRIVPVSPGDEKIKLSQEPRDWARGRNKR